MTEKSKNGAKRSLENFFHAEDAGVVEQVVSTSTNALPYKREWISIERANTILREHVKENGKKMWNVDEDKWYEDSPEINTGYAFKKSAILLDEKEIK